MALFGISVIESLKITYHHVNFRACHGKITPGNIFHSLIKDGSAMPNNL